MKVTFSGGSEIEQALRALPRSAAKSAVRRILKKAAARFAEAANAGAPEGSDHNLKGSYGVGSRLTKRQASLARKEGRDDVVVYAGTADPAGQQQEFGNARHGAQPHARPAWDQTQNDIFSDIQDGLSAEVEKTVARYARRVAKRNK